MTSIHPVHVRRVCGSLEAARTIRARRRAGEFPFGIVRCPAHSQSRRSANGADVGTSRKDEESGEHRTVPDILAAPNQKEIRGPPFLTPRCSTVFRTIPLGDTVALPAQAECRCTTSASVGAIRSCSSTDGPASRTTSAVSLCRSPASPM